MAKKPQRDLEDAELLEQVFRDVRISSVWEGTTQIQALDLLGRKIMLQKLKPINEHCSMLYKYAGGLAASPPSSRGRLRSHALALLRALSPLS